MKNKRLFWHLFPTYILLVSLTLALLMGLGSIPIKDFFFEKTRTDLESRAKLLSTQLLPYLRNGDLHRVQEIIKELGEKSSTRFTVIDLSGNVLADSVQIPSKMNNHLGREEIQLAIAQNSGTSIRYSESVNDQLMYYATMFPVSNNEKIILRVSLPLTALNKTLNHIFIRVSVSAFGLLLIMALFSWWMAKRMSKPLEKIRQQARNFAKGDFTKQIVFRSRDPLELYQLGTSLNDLARELDKKIKTIVSQNDQQNAIFTNMAEGVMVVEPTGPITFMNPAAQEILKITYKSSEPLDLFELKELIPLKELILQSSKSDSPQKKELRLGSGLTEKIIDVYSSPLRRQEDLPEALVVVLSDVTQLKKLESHRKDFVANVSHELRTPLTSIQGYAELLIDSEGSENPNSKKFVEIIHRHALRLEKIIEDLLSLSRMEREIDNSEIEFRHQSLKGCLLSAIEVCEVAASKRNIHIKVDCDANLFTLLNSPLMEQALVNLITNAIKYSPENSAVKVMARKLGHEIEISVIDIGIGIAQEELPRLFERFYRVDKARSRDLGGTGLGLSIVKHVTLAHKGRVEVTSQLGKGSTFSIYVPHTESIETQSLNL